MQDKDTLYARWASGEIDEDELKALRDEGALEELDGIMKAADQWTLPKYDTTAGYERLKEKQGLKKTKVRQINWYWTASIAAGLVLLFFVKVIFLSSNDQVLMAQNGVNEKVILVDGSNILVNDGSSITYNTQNWDQERTINLNGEAFFEVEKGSPFEVNTDNGTIRVLGTKFNVRAWGSNIYVECYEGKVQVIVDKQEVILVQNESINVVKGDMEGKLVIEHQAPFWMSGNSRFYKESIEDVFAELERQYDVTVKVNVSTINRSFSGNFEHSDLENAVRNICKPLGVQYSISEDKKTVQIE